MGERDIKQGALLESGEACTSLGRDIRGVEGLQSGTPLVEVVLLAWIRAGESKECFAQAPFGQERARRDLKHGALYAMGQVQPARHAAELQCAETVTHCVD